jgi:hypothetical protein
MKTNRGTECECGCLSPQSVIIAVYISNIERQMKSASCVGAPAIMVSNEDNRRQLIKSVLLAVHVVLIWVLS